MVSNRCLLGLVIAGVVGEAVSMSACLAQDAFKAPCVDENGVGVGFDDRDGCGKSAVMRQMWMAERERWDCAPGRGGGGDGGGLREPPEATDVLHNSIDIEIVPSATTITGSNTFLVKSLQDGLTQFTIRLRSNFTVTSVVMNGTTPVSITTPPADNSSYGRTITLDRAYNANEVFTVQVSYTGVPVSRGFGSIDFTTQNGLALVETLSEPYYAGTWWPCKDGDVLLPGDNSDKTTFDISVTAPSAMRTVSNGVLTDTTDLSGGRRRHHWVTSYPTATYLACFCSTTYNTWTQTYTYPAPGGGTATMPVEFNVYPASDTPAHRAVWELCLTMMATYRPIYGEYPFVNEKYGIYQFNFSGGQEHQTNTGQGVFDESITSHELGHQWWGDNVTCRTWHDIWLNESFATYTEALWLERKPGSSGLPALFAAMAGRRPSAVNDAVYVYDTSDPNRIFSTAFTYRKGAWALHSLRKVVGDEAFFNILAAYRAAYQGSAATTDEFAAVASAIAGQDLTWFFNEWIYQIGAPAYQYGFQNVAIGGQNYVRLHVQQVQSNTYPVFTMPMDVRVDRAGGSSTVTVWDNAAMVHYLIPVSAPATGVVLDENSWILATAKTAVAYVPGAPKVVAAAPAPGQALGVGAGPSQVVVTFSDNVTCAAGDFSVVRAGGGAVPFGFSYSAGAQAATLAFGSALGPGTYTVTVADTVHTAAGALDGEIATPPPPAALPSGDGQAGGAAVYTFTVAGASCPADFDGNGRVEPADVAAFVNVWFGSLQGGTLAGDFDHDGAVAPADIAAFVNVWLAALTGGC